MRNIITLLAGAAALASVPAMAQVGGGIGGAVRGTVGAPPAMPSMPSMPSTASIPATVPAVPATSPAVTATTDTHASATAAARVSAAPAVNATSKARERIEANGQRMVDRTQQTTDRTTRKLSSTSLTLVTADQVTAGLVVRDQRGQRIGTVSSVSGTNAIVVSGKRSYTVPLSDLYTSSTARANTLISSLSRAKLSGRVRVHANARSAVGTGN